MSWNWRKLLIRREQAVRADPPPDKPYDQEQESDDLPPDQEMTAEDELASMADKDEHGEQADDHPA